MAHEKKILPKLRRKMDRNILCTSSGLKKQNHKDARISPIQESMQVLPLPIRPITMPVKNWDITKPYGTEDNGHKPHNRHKLKLPGSFTWWTQDSECKMSQRPTMLKERRLYGSSMWQWNVNSLWEVSAKAGKRMLKKRGRPREGGNDCQVIQRVP